MTDNMVAIAIDGACWPLIDEWIEAGKLPNIAALREGGTWGTLQSCVPPVTCPAWKCYSTGKNPGKLGVFWWENLDIDDRTSSVPTARDFPEPELWDLLNNAGVSTGVVGMPLTYPPKTLDGFMVAGGPGAPDSGYAAPDSIEAELESEFGYTPRPTYPSNVDEESKERFIEESIEQVDRDFRAARYLHEEHPVDFLQICSFEINGPLQHLFYDGNPTKRAWQVIDEHVGELREEFDHVVIHSDHGTSEMERQFYVNSWLDREGYLARDVTMLEWVANLGLNRDAIRGALDRAGLREPLSNVSLLRAIAQHIPNSSGLFGETEGAAIFDKVDWNATRAVGLAQGPLYLNNEGLSEAEYNRFRSNLATELETFINPESGETPIQTVFRREQIYHGEYVDDAPDLVALDSPRYHNKGGIGKDELFAESDWRGNNARDGLYVVAGPDVNNDRTNADIYDLAPTILEFFDVNIPNDVDGSPLSFGS